MKGSPRRRARALVTTLFALASLAIPAAASAETQTFRSFEATATANYVVTKTCPDGSTVTQRVTVIGGHEEETGEPDNDFVTVLLRGFECDGSFFSDRGSGPAEFTYSPSLQTASVSGTITTFGGRTVAVDMTWEGTGPLEAESRTNTFSGFVGHFEERERAAVATGTVVVDGQTLVDGSTTNAFIRTMEDTNITTGQP